MNKNQSGYLHQFKLASVMASVLGLFCFISLSSFGQDIEAGKKLFGTHCETCHGPNGDGNGPAAEAFILKPRDFALAAFKFDTDADWQKGTDTDLEDVIREGPAAFGGSNAMPGWSQLTDTEIANLIEYIRSLKS